LGAGKYQIGIQLYHPGSDQAPIDYMPFVQPVEVPSNSDILTQKESNEQELLKTYKAIRVLLSPADTKIAKSSDTVNAKVLSYELEALQLKFPYDVLDTKSTRFLIKGSKKDYIHQAVEFMGVRPLLLGLAIDYSLKGWDFDLEICDRIYHLCSNNFPGRQKNNDNHQQEDAQYLTNANDLKELVQLVESSHPMFKAPNHILIDVASVIIENTITHYGEKTFDTSLLETANKIVAESQKFANFGLPHGPWIGLTQKPELQSYSYNSSKEFIQADPQERHDRIIANALSPKFRHQFEEGQNSYQHNQSPYKINLVLPSVPNLKPFEKINYVKEEAGEETYKQLRQVMEAQENELSFKIASTIGYIYQAMEELDFKSAVDILEQQPEIIMSAPIAESICNRLVLAIINNPTPNISELENSFAIIEKWHALAMENQSPSLPHLAFLLDSIDSLKVISLK
jgi:hypothetical protein